MSDLSIDLPNLISFCAFDGIPPQKEGEDPTVIWYYPEETSMNDQLNMVGLYLTFMGFAADFRAGEWEYFQTDKCFCCIQHLGAQLYVAAAFALTDDLSPRYCIQQLQVFKSIFGIVFPPPTRDPETNLLEKNNEITKSFMDMLKIFKHRPILKRIKPTLELWNVCEEALAIAKYSMPNIRSASFIYKDRLVHTSMHTNDALAFYIAYKANISRFFIFKPDFEPDTFQWLTGLVKEKNQTLYFLPTVTIYEGLVLLAVVRYNDLVMFISLLMPKDMTKETLIPLEEPLKTIMPNIAKICKKTLDGDKKDSVAAYRNDGKVEITAPMNPAHGLIANDKATNRIVETLDKNDSDFIRFVGRLENDHWLFAEKDGNTTTIIDEVQPTFPDAASNAVTYIRLNYLG